MVASFTSRSSSSSLVVGPQGVARRSVVRSRSAADSWDQALALCALPPPSTPLRLPYFIGEHRHRRRRRRASPSAAKTFRGRRRVRRGLLSGLAVSFGNPLLRDLVRRHSIATSSRNSSTCTRVEAHPTGRSSAGSPAAPNLLRPVHAPARVGTCGPRRQAAAETSSGTHRILRKYGMLLRRLQRRRAPWSSCMMPSGFNVVVGSSSWASAPRPIGCTLSLRIRELRLLLSLLHSLAALPPTLLPSIVRPRCCCGRCSSFAGFARGGGSVGRLATRPSRSRRPAGRMHLASWAG